MLRSYIRFFLENKFIAWLLMIILIIWGLIHAPFDIKELPLPKDPVPVDAIPDIGENQQIVYSTWKGRSPQDVEDQVSFPLTTALLGIPGVKHIRSNSMFGFSTIYIIFDDEVEFYWSRSRILEKLNSLPMGLLPEGVQPSLGPDATALGQIFWYTLEGRDSLGRATGGWDPQELRSIQDFYVRYGLSGAEGVAEVASIGGYVKEYQVDVRPEAMRSYGISLEQVMAAVKGSNLDIGAQTIEINLAEYFVRGLGYIKSLDEIEQSVVVVNNNVPIRIGDIAHVHLGPANRRGVLDKSGAEAVGGVVVARFGSNPLAVIEAVKEKIKALEPGLPNKTLSDGTISHVKVVPFYDRTQLIQETLGTLQETLNLEILITFIVVVLMLFQLRASLLVGSMLPIAVLICFIAMRYAGVDANIVALAGIAIAIGTMVDMGIVLTESIVQRLEQHVGKEPLLATIREASLDVGSAILTAVATTVLSFLPVFTMEAAEGKLFQPLAYTKTFALIGSILVTLTFVPPLAHILFSINIKRVLIRNVVYGGIVILGITLFFFIPSSIACMMVLVGLSGFVEFWLKENHASYLALFRLTRNVAYASCIAWLLTQVWMPLGVGQSFGLNFLFVALVIGIILGFFSLIIRYYPTILRFFLDQKAIFFLIVSACLLWGLQVFREIGGEFMPALDEGAFLLMPTAMPHAGMQENIKNLRLLDMAVTAIPEVETVVGKAGRVESPLDPAPMSMYENIILYKSEYKTDQKGHRVRFAFDNETNSYYRDERGNLILDPKGKYFRQWRDHIQSPEDIWTEITRVSHFPGLTSAPKLQPIETRIVMQQTGMRSPMGIKVRGSQLADIEALGLRLESLIKEVEGVHAPSVFADRIVGKPYLLIDIQRDVISSYGLDVAMVQKYIQAAVGGMQMTTTVEGRERYAIRVRYPRELRDDPERLKRIYLPAADGSQVPLGSLVNIRYEQGPQSIKSEDGFLVAYVLFDKQEGYSEGQVVKRAQEYLHEQIKQGNLIIPAGTNYQFAGNYQQQIRANKRLALVLPLALLLIFVVLYLHFRSIVVSIMVFIGVAIAFAGGFIMLGLYDQAWFLDFDVFGQNMRDLFQVRTINLSVAVWVGFLALFGIATDDGVLVATFLQDRFKGNKPHNKAGIRQAVIEGGTRRVRPAMMTTATTLLALLPILTSTGRGADLMLPMAIPTFGGMILQTLTMFTVPILYAMWQEFLLSIRSKPSKK